MSEEANQQQSPLGLILIFIIVVIVPLAIGAFLAPRLIPAPQIGIIRLNYEIGGLTAQEFGEQLAYARENPAIKGIVFIINSPGGSAAYSEEMYLDILNTRKTLPVVASIDLLAASGGYYAAAAANEIYAKPTSTVGSIGVIASLPGDALIEEDLLTTGPYKGFGGTRDGFTRQMEAAKQTFLEAVSNGRGERLNADLDYLSRAEVFTGLQALDLGLVDGLLATDETVQRTADLAGLRDYETVELYPLVYGEDQPAPFFKYQAPPVDTNKLWAAPTDLSPGLYYRYIVPIE